MAALKPRPNRYAFPDPELRGHYVRVQPGGGKTFVTVARNPQGKQVWTNIDAADVLKIEEAREKARETIARVRAGLPAIEASADSFGAVTSNWMKRHVEPMSRVQRPAQRRLLDHIHVLENEERSVCWLRSSRCREFPLARQAGSRQVHV